LVRAIHEHATCGAPIVNLQLAPPLSDEAPIAAGTDAIALATEGELLDAVEARRTQVGLALADLDRLSGLALGHSSKCLSPARIKRPTTQTLYRLLDALALSVVLVTDPTKAARISPAWRPRDASHVRDRALSPRALERARPVVLAELARKAARPRWAGVPARDFLRAMVEQSQ
jgi:hypothetical protein